MKDAREKREAENRKFYQETTDYTLGKHKDTYRDKISDKRREELLKQILEKRNEQSEADLKALKVTEINQIDDNYRARIRDYYQDEYRVERIRTHVRR